MNDRIILLSLLCFIKAKCPEARLEKKVSSEVNQPQAAPTMDAQEIGGFQGLEAGALTAAGLDVQEVESFQGLEAESDQVWIEDEPKLPMD